jgi:hypothetical protein
MVGAPMCSFKMFMSIVIGLFGYFATFYELLKSNELLYDDYGWLIQVDMRGICRGLF